MIELVIARDGQEINRYFLPQGITTLGRADDNEIILDDVCVSRRHAQIRVEGGQVLIEDLGSGNGTFAGDTRIARKELAHGDEIVIEPFSLTLRKQATGDAPSASKRTPAKTVPPKDMPASEKPERLEPTGNVETDGGGANPLSGPHLETIRGTGGRYLLSSEEVRIGRSEDQDIMLKDPSASRGHAILSIRNGRFILRDNASANGTFVNGKQISEYSLRPGDVILIGNTELRFVDPDSDKPSVTKNSGASAGMEMEMPMYEEASTAPPVAPGGMAAASVGGTSSGGFGVQPATEPGYDGTIPGGPPEVFEPSTDFGAAPGAIIDDHGFDQEPMTEAGMPPPPLGGPPVPYNPNLGGGGGGMMGGGGGGGMEMDLDGGGLYPQHGPGSDSLLSKFAWSFKHNKNFRLMSIGAGVFLLLVLFIAAISNQGTGAGGGGEVALKGLQAEYFMRAEQTYANAQDAYDSRDLPEAIRLYERTLKQAGADELSNVPQARRLVRDAQRQVLILHEVSVIKMIGDSVDKRAKIIRASADQIAKAKRSMESAYRSAQRSGTLSNWQRVISTSGTFLQMVPSNKDAREYRSEGQREVNRIAGAMNANKKEKIRTKVVGIWNRAAQQKRRGDASSYNAAIRTLATIKSADPTNVAGYNSRADAEIRAIKKSLDRSSEPLIAQARAELQRRQFIPMRSAASRALEINPYSREAASLLSKAESECTKSAQSAFKKAKVFESINNYSDAREQCRKALKYHPRGSDLFNVKCRELFKTLDRKQEGLR